MASPSELTMTRESPGGYGLILAGGAVVVVSLIAILLNQPLVAAAVLVVSPLAAGAIYFPHLITPLVVFVLYSNAAVVAVKFHNVPSFAAALVPAMLLIPLTVYLVIRRQELMITGTLPFAVLFILIQACGVAGARYQQESFNALQTSVLEGLALYVLVINVVRTRSDAISALWALLLAGCCMGGLSLFQQVTGTFDRQYGGFAQIPGLGFQVVADGIASHQARLCGPIGEQNRYAQFMLMLVPLGLSQVWGETIFQRKTIAAVATALCACGCILAFSRGAAVGFALMLVLMTIMRQLQVRQLALIMASALLFALAIPQYAARLTSLTSLFSLATNQASSVDEVDGAIRGRATEMMAAVRVSADYPLMGVGPGMFDHYSSEYGNEGGLRALEGDRQAHCLYLELSAEHGLPGLICFMAMTGMTLVNLTRMRRLWRSRDRRMEYMATGYILALASYLTTGLFLHFSYIRYFWLVLALADATSNVGRMMAESGAAKSATPQEHLSGNRSK